MKYPYFWVAIVVTYTMKLCLKIFAKNYVNNLEKNVAFKKCCNTVIINKLGTVFGIQGRFSAKHNKNSQQGVNFCNRTGFQIYIYVLKLKVSHKSELCGPATRTTLY